MDNIEHSCRKSSKIFSCMAKLSKVKRNREVLYQLALDTYMAAVWIEAHRKMEFMFAQMYPDEYKKALESMEPIEIGGRDEADRC